MHTTLVHLPDARRDVAAELHDLEVRAQRQQLGATSQTFPVLLSSFGPGPVFLGYAVIGAIAFVFVQTLVTETKGRSLEEIEADLQSRAHRRARREREMVASG